MVMRFKSNLISIKNNLRCEFQSCWLADLFYRALKTLENLFEFKDRIRNYFKNPRKIIDF